MSCKNSTNGNFCRKFHPNSHTTSRPTHKVRRHNARIGLRGISNRWTKLAFWNIKHLISSVKSFTRQLKKCANMHNEITENTWKAGKRHKLKRSRKHVINISRRYLGKNWIATKRGPPYPHNERGQSMFLVFIAVSGAIEKNLFTFSTKTIRKCSYTSDKIQFLLHSCAGKRFQKLIGKHDVSDYLILSSPQRTVSMTTPAEIKRFHQFSYLILSPENKVRRHNDGNEWKSTVTTHQECLQN